QELTSLHAVQHFGRCEGPVDGLLPEETAPEAVDPQIGILLVGANRLRMFDQHYALRELELRPSGGRTGARCAGFVESSMKKRLDGPWDIIQIERQLALPGQNVCRELSGRHVNEVRHALGIFQIEITATGEQSLGRGLPRARAFRAIVPPFQAIVKLAV